MIDAHFARRAEEVDDEGVFEGVDAMREEGGEDDDGAGFDDLLAVFGSAGLAEGPLDAAADDVGDLFADVVVLGDVAAFLEPYAGEEDLVSEDALAEQVGDRVVFGHLVERMNGGIHVRIVADRLGELSSTERGLITMRQAFALAPFALLALAAVQGCTPARAQEPRETTGTRDGIELTVYSQNFAMVSENRSVDLPAGGTTVRVAGVSRMLDQNSVMFSFPDARDVKASSSTYDLGMDTSGELLSRFLGQEVTLVYRGDNGQAGERQKGILEVAQTGNVVVRVGDKYVVNPDATIEAPANAGIVTIPQLSAEVTTKAAAKGTMNVAYLTEGLSWSADYTLTLAPGSSDLGIECWATINNQSGADYPGAKINFVAGGPNRSVRASRAKMEGGPGGGGAFDEEFGFGDAAQMRMAPQAGSPTSVGELYAYPYESIATVRHNQTNRVLMMSADAVRAERDYSIMLPSFGRWYGSLPDASYRHQAKLGLNFSNSEKTGLGKPLPMGSVRVYEPSTGGAPVYIGAAQIGNTPKDGKIHLTLSDVFDVYATAKILKKRVINKKQSEYTFEAVIHNEKKLALEVRLVQSFYDKFTFSSQSVKGKKMTNGTTEWKVNVPAGGEAKLTYTVVLS